MLKVAARCDLACDYCYVYESVDQSWRHRPHFIAPSTVAAAAERIAEHAERHRLARVRVILHGGEPLLAGPARLRDIVERLRAALGDRLELGLQTNGVLLTEDLCDLFVEQGVRVGVSLDGDAAAHDRHRRRADGRGSHAEVRRALEMLRRPEYRAAYAGLLCTVDLANDPVAVYDALVREQPPAVDFLLPHANWDRPPSRPGGGATPYAQWLLAVHRRWVETGRPVGIRLLDSLRTTLGGGMSGTEAVGLSPAALVVIESDGSFEQVDALKTAFDGAPATGRSVFADTVDDVAGHPLIAVRQIGLAGLCATCRSCPVVRHCGGGHFAHRYGDGHFDNPSAYCADLQALIGGLLPRPPGLDPALLDDLGTGYGTPAAVVRLALVHSSFVRAYLAALGPRAERDPLAAPAWSLLRAVDREHPAAVRAVLAHPFVRTWAADASGSGRGLAQLAGLAAAAALRAGVTAELTVPVHKGLVVLPSLGVVAAEPGAAVARLHIDHGAVAGDPVWQRPHEVTAAGRTLVLDDVDPYRDCFGVPVTGRLTAAEARSWAGRLDDALGWAAERIPQYLPGLEAALRVVVPLRPDPGGGLRSATARSAFGAVAVAPAPDAPSLATLLVHEVQHVKLGAVMDACDLFDRADPRRVAVPWRKDRRPIEGALHGCYAFAAVADVWRHRSGPAAREQFERYRGWVGRTVEQLLTGGGLTAGGVRFVERLRATLAGW
ncbi:FxsB family cyclophane-forming radical SAM/SPASM peptide maturase [Dactylosporangium sp. McL0621]|uniref:FxsB family cyclophane-forming radical SAM/SPASM peptide maturase n=1 Tax=Dactylosporangium sp. McL0621 TaxID=3415678 RepID=UPI003CE9E5E5